MSNFRRLLTRRWLLGILGVIALLFGLAMLHPYPRQSLFGPTIRGKPWCVWENAVRRYVHHEEHEKTWPAKTMRWLGVKQDEMQNVELFDHAEMLPLLLVLLEDQDPLIRWAALGEITRFSSLQHASALPVLRGRLHEEALDERMMVARAIWQIEKDRLMLPVILREWNDPQSKFRDHAAWHLEEIGADAPELFPVLVAHAKDPDLHVREHAIVSMKHFGKKGVPVLIQSLNDPVDVLRLVAIDLLGTLGPEAKEALPALEPFLNDADGPTRASAYYALVAIDPERGQHLKP